MSTSVFLKAFFYKFYVVILEYLDPSVTDNQQDVFDSCLKSGYPAQPLVNLQNDFN